MDHHPNGQVFSFSGVDHVALGEAILRRSSPAAVTMFGRPPIGSVPATPPGMAPRTMLAAPATSGPIAAPTALPPWLTWTLIGIAAAAALAIGWMLVRTGAPRRRGSPRRSKMRRRAARRRR